MTILIGAIMLLSLAVQIYRTGRRFLGRSGSSNPAIARLFDTEEDHFSSAPASTGEAREVDLSRQLLDGRLDRCAYQQAMTALAQPDSDRAGTR